MCQCVRQWQRVWSRQRVVGSVCGVKLAFYDADTDTDTDILARIVARMSVSVSVSWNAGFTLAGV